MVVRKSSERTLRYILQPRLPLLNHKGDLLNLDASIQTEEDIQPQPLLNGFGEVLIEDKVPEGIVNGSIIEDL